jgi:hypothetical protein
MLFISTVFTNQKPQNEKNVGKQRVIREKTP